MFRFVKNMFCSHKNIIWFMPNEAYNFDNTKIRDLFIVVCPDCNKVLSVRTDYWSRVTKINTTDTN